MKTIVLTGGGTAGHVMPNIALLPYLKKHFARIVYIGSGGIEEKILSDYPEISFYKISCAKLKRSLSFSNLAIPFKVFLGIRQCKKLLDEIEPSVIFSKGGFVALPVCLAAHKLGIPVVSHESDLTLGLANKMIYKKCTTFCTSFAETAQNRKKAVHTGTAMRDSLFQGNQKHLPGHEKLEPTKKTVLFIGGSLGAARINQAVTHVLPKLCSRYNIIHITGKNSTPIANAPKNYLPFTFLSDPQHAYSAADLVVSRAGSNAIFEFLALNKPMLLVPLGKAASRGDQIVNAHNFLSNEYAMVLDNEDCTGDTLYKTILALDKVSLIMKEKQRASNIKNGNEKIITEILKVTKVK